MKKIILCLLAAAALVNLSFAKAVKRGGAGDLTPYLSETDSRAICKDIVDQVIRHPRVQKFEDKNGRPPIVTIGKIKDETGEFFDTQIIANSLKTAILNSGVLEFMANSDIRNEMRDEVKKYYEEEVKDVMAAKSIRKRAEEGVKTILTENEINICINAIQPVIEEKQKEAKEEKGTALKKDK